MSETASYRRNGIMEFCREGSKKRQTRDKPTGFGCILYIPPLSSALCAQPRSTDGHKFGVAASTVSRCLRAWPQRDGHNGTEQPRPGATAQYSNGRPTWKTFAGAEASRARRAGRSWPSFVQIVRTRDCRMRLLEAVVNHFVGGETSTGGCWTRCGPLHVIPRASWCSQRGTRVSAHPS